MVNAAKDKPKFYVPAYFDPPKAERGPCPRNREIFDGVKFRRLSLRAAAEKYQLSPTRIQQIVRQVEDWICRTGGGPTRTWQERLRTAEYLYRGQTDADREAVLEAYHEGVTLRTEKYVIRDGKLDHKVVIDKNTKGDTRLLATANRISSQRQKFEDARPAPPSIEDMPSAERLREMMITAEEMARQLAEAEKDQAEATPPVQAPLTPDGDLGPVDDLPPAEDAEQRYEATPAPEQRAEEIVETVKYEPRPAPPPRKDPLAGVDLSQYAPLPPPDPYRFCKREYPNTPDGLPPPMILIERPTDEELEQYWILEDGLRTWRPPTVLGKRDPRFDIWHRYQPNAPNPAVKKKKKG